MPIVSSELALVLISCFVIGWLVSYAVQTRRFHHERDERERSIARALQARYATYEGLEQSVLKLRSKFDALEGDFKHRLVEAEHPTLPLEQTLKLRSHNPELWDIERENQRVQARLLAEVSKQRSRVVDLMQQLQALEPETQRLGDEVARTRQRHERAVANARESEQAALARAVRMESRVHELESALTPMSQALRAAHAQVAQLRSQSSSHDAQLEAAWSALSDLKPMLEVLENGLEKQLESEPSAAQQFDLSMLDDSGSSAK